MRSEIFVVKTEITRKQGDTVGTVEDKIKRNLELLAVKTDLVKEFGGLTEIGNFKGYWTSNGVIYTDIGDIWLIYSDSGDTLAIIDGFAKRVKIITLQQSQLYTIDGKAYFV
jgi:hypothetical protein